MNKASLKELSDEELVAIARAEGGNDAVIELMNRVSGFIGYKAAQFAKSGCDDMQDFSQQGLMDVIYAIHSYDADKGVKFSTYACRCAINSMIRFRDRQKKRSVPTVALDSLYSAEEFINTKDDLQSYEFVEEMAQKIKTRLSDFEKTVLVHYLRGKTYAQISDTTGKTVKSIDNAMQRIRRKLRNDED